MTNVVSVDETRKNLSEIFDKAQYGKERFLVRKNRKPAVIIMGAEDYEDLMEIMAELQDEDFNKSLKKSRKEYEQGKTYSLVELKNALSIK